MTSESASRQTNRRSRLRLGWTVGSLMIFIAIIGLGLGVYQRYRRAADDWAFDRREVSQQQHEAAFFARIPGDLEAGHRSNSEPVFVIHGYVYRISPDLNRYVESMIDYHTKEQERHQRAIGRWWIIDSPASRPEPPSRVPDEEAERIFNKTSPAAVPSMDAK